MARQNRDLDKMIHELVVQLEQGLVLQKNFMSWPHFKAAAWALHLYSSCLRFCFASSRICILSSQIQTKDWRFIMHSIYLYKEGQCSFWHCFGHCHFSLTRFVGSQNQKLWFIWTSCCKVLPAGNQPDTLRDIATQGLENHSFMGLSDPT